MQNTERVWVREFRREKDAVFVIPLCFYQCQCLSGSHFDTQTTIFSSCKTSTTWSRTSTWLWISFGCNFTRGKKKKVFWSIKKWLFWLNIIKNWVYLWYRYCSNLFEKIRKEVNFGNGVTKIPRKSKRVERNDVTGVGERKGNFNNDIAKNKNK